MSEKEYLSFEKLIIWEKAVDYCVEVIDLIDTINTDRKHFKLIDQLEGSSSSIASNIAEGKGRWSKKEFKQFLYYYRGSLYESITQLNIICKKGWIDIDQFEKIREKALELNKMLSSMIFKIKESI
jgi:four helix bundle protein